MDTCVDRFSMKIGFGISGNSLLFPEETVAERIEISCIHKKNKTLEFSYHPLRVVANPVPFLPKNTDIVDNEFTREIWRNSESERS
jgi:hypothetical protein